MLSFRKETAVEHIEDAEYPDTLVDLVHHPHTAKRTIVLEILNSFEDTSNLHFHVPPGSRNRLIRLLQDKPTGAKHTIGKVIN